MVGSILLLLCDSLAQEMLLVCEMAHLVSLRKVGLAVFLSV